MGTAVHPTFKQMMNEVVAYGSCCECGSCVLVCPHNVIDYIDSKPKQVAKATNPFDHCGISEGIGGDFSAELADISCGGLGATNWTITVLRSEKGVETFDAIVRDGLLDVQPIEEFESSMKVFLRLTRKQRARVPVTPGRTAAFVRPPGFGA